MNSPNETSGESKFDVKWLKALYEDLHSEMKVRDELMGKMETHMATTNQILSQLKSDRDAHAKLISDNGKEIVSLKLANASCDAPQKVVQHDRELKRLNAFMDMFKRGGMDTGVIDTHAQKMQAAAEAAIRDSIPMRQYLWKMFPWMLLFGIFCVVVTTLIMAKVATGKDIQLPDPPSIQVNANSSSHEVHR